MGLSEWLKSPSTGEVSNEVFYKAQDLVRKRGEKTPPPKEGSVVVRLHDPDLGNLGKHRQKGVAWDCGNFVEVFRGFQPTLTGISPDTTSEAVDTGETEEEKRKKYALKSAYRAAKNVRRLVNTAKCRYMWTLTTAPLSYDNLKKYKIIPIEEQRDYDAMRAYWKAFIRKLRRFYDDLDWLVVFELHDSEKTSTDKKDTWHIHFATPQWLSYGVVCQCWKHGGCQYEDFQKPRKQEEGKTNRQEVRNPGAYMSKYVGKNFTASNADKKRYTVNRGFPRPHKMDIDTFYEKFPILDLKVVYSTAKKDEEAGINVTLSITYQKPLEKGKDKSNDGKTN